MFVNKYQKRIFLLLLTFHGRVPVFPSISYKARIGYSELPNLPFSRKVPTAFFVDMVYN